jgi:hypothetical protein
MPDLEPEMRGEQRIREVFVRVGRGDLGAADLYADDAVLAYGKGGRVEGREAIRAFYERIIDSIHPQPSVEAVLESHPLYVAILDVPTTDGGHRTLDLFELGEGGIQRLEIYTQP